MATKDRVMSSDELNDLQKSHGELEIAKTGIFVKDLINAIVQRHYLGAAEFIIRYKFAVLVAEEGIVTDEQTADERKVLLLDASDEQLAYDLAQKDVAERGWVIDGRAPLKPPVYRVILSKK